MIIKKSLPLVFCLLYFHSFFNAQDWNLKLRSKVELRTWKLTSQAAKFEKLLQGATITLYKDSTVIGQTITDPEGNFEIAIPPHGDYTLKITYPGCNAKKFAVSTKGVPDKATGHSFKPSVTIAGFMMSKGLKGVDYLGLNQPLVKVEYKQAINTFDKDEHITAQGNEILSKIYDGEEMLAQKFCNMNKLGDEALQKKNYELAKSYYQKALDIFDNEQYPKDQMKRAEEGLKSKDLSIDLSQIKIQPQHITANMKHATDKVAGAMKKAASKPISFCENVTTKISGSDDNKNQRIAKPIGMSQYEKCMAKAEEHVKQKQWKEAKCSYEEVLRIKPHDATASAKLAEVKKHLSGS